MATLTVFTPLYNRIKTLKRTYKSLQNQTCKDFVWLIVDDGSTDNPYEEIKNWLNEDNGFEIKYIYKENGGMHTAHNTAYENIDTELNVCIDSDDYMPNNAVELIIDCWNENKDKGYAGIIALDFADSTKKVIGKELPADIDSTTLMGYYNNGGLGDKKLIYRTDIIKNTPPYPVFEGEKYVALAYKYRLIDQNYKLLVVPEVLCNVEYQSDGSSNTMWSQYLKNPRGFAFWRKVCMQYPISRKRLVMDCIHYCSSSQIAGNKKYIQESPKRLLTFFCTPMGWILTSVIRKKTKK